MQTARIERLTAIAGLVVVALSLVNLTLPPVPAGDAPATAFAGYYAAHRTAVLVVAYVAVLGAAVVVAFLAGLRDLLRRHEAGDGTLATTGLVAGVVEFTAVAVGLSILAAAAYRPGQPAETIRALTDAGWVVINLGAGLPTAVSVAAFSLVVLRTRLLPRWVVGFGLLVSVAHLVVSGAFARGGFLAPEGAIAVVVPTLYYLWVLVVSLTLLRRRTPRSAA